MEERLTKAELKEQRHKERIDFESRMKKQESREKLKKIGIWLGGFVILALSVWGLIALTTTPTPTTPHITAPKINSTDITFGPKDAKTTLIEYADFQCPACGYYYSFVKQAHKDFDGKVLFVYRFFPLAQIHQNAVISSKAAYAANLQGKFWDMHDLLFSHQNDWATVSDPTKIFVGYAKQLNLDTDKFLTDMALPATAKFIQDQEDAGVTAGVNSTPSFFVNGTYFTNPQTYDEFKSIIQNGIK